MMSNHQLSRPGTPQWQRPAKMEIQEVEHHYHSKYVPQSRRPGAKGSRQHSSLVVQKLSSQRVRGDEYFLLRWRGWPQYELEVRPVLLHYALKSEIARVERPCTDVSCVTWTDSPLGISWFEPHLHRLHHKCPCVRIAGKPGRKRRLGTARVNCTKIFLLTYWKGE